MLGECTFALECHTKIQVCIELSPNNTRTIMPGVIWKCKVSEESGFKSGWILAAMERMPRL
jgi:hypothetical protein